MIFDKPRLGKYLLSCLLYDESIRQDGCDGGQYKRYYDALEAGTLEIEGYERVEWTKFDRRDQKTFPPHDKIVVIALRDGHVGPAFVRWICNWCEFAGYSHHDVTHWRPLPPPPVETEVKK